MANDSGTDVAVRKEDKVARPEHHPIILDYEAVIKDFIPKHVDPDKFFLMANSVLQSSPFLLDCIGSGKGAQGFVESLKQAAIDGLIPDGKREAAIVPYSGVPTYVRMYGGMLKMMRQSGEISSIRTGLVCENDVFDFNLGTKQFIDHQPAFQDRGQMIAAWCIISTKSGGDYMDVMGRDEIIQIKNAARSKKGPWHNKAHEGQMWRKTVLRRTAGLAPISTDLQNAFAREDEQNYDFTKYDRPAAVDNFAKGLENGRNKPMLDHDPDPENAGDEKIIQDDPKIEPSAAFDKMTGQQWEDYRKALLEDLEKRGISGKMFDRLYKPELDAMAELSVADFDKMLDAFVAADKAESDKA